MILYDLLDRVSREKIKREKEKAAQKFADGMVISVSIGIGVVAGILAAGIIFITKSGKEAQVNMKNKVVDMVENIKDKAYKKAELVKDSAAHTAQKAGNVIKDVHEKKEGVKKEISDGYHEITQDINKVAENISNELKKSVK